MFNNSITLSATGSENMNRSGQLVYNLNTIAQFPESSTKTLAPPSRGLIGAASGSSTTHSAHVRRNNFAGIQRFISWLFRRPHRSTFPNEQFNEFTRSLLSNFGEPADFQLLNVEDITAPSEQENNNIPTESILSSFQDLAFRVLLSENLPAAAQNEEIPAAFDLLTISHKELQRRLQETRSRREMIEIRRPAIEEWFSGIQELLRENRQQWKQLFAMIEGKKQEIQDHCLARKRRVRDARDRYRAYHNREGENSLRDSEGSQSLEMSVLGNFDSLVVHVVEVQENDEDLLIDLPVNSEEKLGIFSSQYNARVNNVLKYGIKKIETEGREQDKKAYKEKENLVNEYTNRCTSSGIKSLYAYEVNLIREVRKQYENVQSMKGAFREFIKGIRELEEADARVLNLGNIMEEVYRRAKELGEISAWQELRISNGGGGKPLVLMEKRGYFWFKGALGKMDEIRIALTADKFLMIYKVNKESREPTVYAEFKVEEIMGRKDVGGSLVLIGQEVKEGVFWSTKREFRIEFLEMYDLNHFLEFYNESYERSFLEEDLLRQRHRHRY